MHECCCLSLKSNQIFLLLGEFIEFLAAEKYKLWEVKMDKENSLCSNGKFTIL